MIKKKYGVRYEPRKMSDYCGGFRCGDIELPSHFILEDKYIPDVRNQGAVNSCVGFATTNVMQILNWKETGKRDRFSAGYFYGGCRGDKDTYEGMYIGEALDYLIKMGTPFESDFPYNEEMPKIRKMVKERPDLVEKAKPYHIKGYETYAQADPKVKIKAIKTALYTYNTPILVASDFPGGSHAVCIIGWNDETEEWKIMNSWGESYGDNGKGDISYESVTRGYLLVDAKNSNILMPFTDVGNEGERWYYNAVKKVYNAGYMNGTSETTFSPDAYLTRAQAAQLIANLVERLDEVRAEEKSSAMQKKGLLEKIKDWLSGLFR